MPIRLFSKKTLEFTAPLKSPRRGRSQGTNAQREAGEIEKVTGDTYVEAIRFHAKASAAAQGWEMDDNDAIYIVAVINVIPLRVQYVKKKRRANDSEPALQSVPDMEKVRSKALMIGSPQLAWYTKILFKALTGVAFKSCYQVVGITVLRRYNSREGLDLLVGAAADWKELIHDIRNA